MVGDMYGMADGGGLVATRVKTCGD